MPRYLAHRLDSRFLCVGFQLFNTVAVCAFTFNEALFASGWCVTPLAYQILCVRFTSFVHVYYSLPTIGSAVRQRRNTRYEWVVNPYERSSRSLSRPGLAPGKKYQALLGALNIRSPHSQKYQRVSTCLKC